MAIAMAVGTFDGNNWLLAFGTFDGCGDSPPPAR